MSGDEGYTTRDRYVAMGVAQWLARSEQLQQSDSNDGPWETVTLDGVGIPVIAKRYLRVASFATEYLDLGPPERWPAQ